MKLPFPYGATLLCALAACSVTDDRPETLAYITETILAPSCGTATCHSAMKRQSDYVFDSVAGAQASIANHCLPTTTAGAGFFVVAPCASPPCEDIPFLASSYLLTVITTEDAQGHRMPRDAPLPNLDLVLIKNWIRDGADGYVNPDTCH